MEHIQVHGVALEGNLEGNAVDRDVFVFLPPGYAKDRHRRYPVVYALHGYFIGAEQWTHEIHVPQTIEGAFAQGAKEMIVVLPDSKTRHNGSFYSGSPTVGDFETFVSPRPGVVHRRALPHAAEAREPRARGSFHGGLRRDAHRHEARGRVRQPVHHESLLPRALSAAPANPEADKAAEAAKTPEDLAKLPFFARIQFATAAAWSPNPHKPPSISTSAPKAASRDRTSSPSGPPMRRCRSWINTSATCAATAEFPSTSATRTRLRVDTAKLHDALDQYGIVNGFEQYSGTHTSRVAYRFQEHVLPFFSEQLCFAETCRSTDQH